MNNVSLSDVLASNFLLVDLNLRTWGAAKTDAVASDDLTHGHGASKGSAVVVKKLLSGNDKELKELQASYNKIRTWFYDNTLPWTSNTEGNRRGKRLMGSKESMTLLGDFAKLKREAEIALKVFTQVYPQLCQNAAAALGTLFNLDDYPTPAKVMTMFGAFLAVSPVPAQTDFTRVSLPAAITTGLQTLYERQAKQQVTNALGDFKERLGDELLRLHGQLSKVAAGEKTRLYKTLLSNLQGLVRLGHSLAPIDAGLTELAKRIQDELLQHEVEEFKENVHLSRTIAERAEALRNDLLNPGAGMTAHPEPEAPQAQEPIPPAAVEPVAEDSAMTNEETQGGWATVSELLAQAESLDVDDMIL
jgi:hypothetical protein